MFLILWNMYLLGKMVKKSEIKEIIIEKRYCLLDISCIFLFDDQRREREIQRKFNVRNLERSQRTAKVLYYVEERSSKLSKLRFLLFCISFV